MDKQEAKYTLGPWQAAENGFSVYASDPHFVVANTLMPDSMLIGPKQEIDAIRDTQRANAHLLAASPLMLEVLKEIQFSPDCPSCGSPRPTRTLDFIDGSAHDKNCKLDIAIKAALNLD